MCMFPIGCTIFLSIGSEGVHFIWSLKAMYAVAVQLLLCLVLLIAWSSNLLVGFSAGTSEVKSDLRVEKKGQEKEEGSTLKGLCWSWSMPSMTTAFGLLLAAGCWLFSLQPCLFSSLLREETA